MAKIGEPAERPLTTTPLTDEPRSRRGRIALSLACLALGAATLGAVGPAKHDRNTYSWPPAVLPSGVPERLWYTPLLLANRHPEELVARIPCTLPLRLPRAAHPLTVLATARSPVSLGGLAIVRTGSTLTYSVGDQVLARTTVPDGRAACSYQLRLKGDRWSLTGGQNGRRRGGSLASMTIEGVSQTMPTVDGFFSGLDLRRSTDLSIEVTTPVSTTHTTTRQAAAWSIGVLSALIALALVTFDRRPRRIVPALIAAARGCLRNARPVDGVVGASLLVWWVIAPTEWDDGWVMARQSMFSASRGFSNYYNIFAANLPVGYWLEWSQHWLVESTRVVPLLRLPALVCLVGTWILCRWIHSRVLAGSVGRDRVAVWALAAAFVVSAFAWGITLRPEPATALLVTGVLACVIRFVERSTAIPLAIAAVLVPLGVTGHHEAIVGLAPVLVVAPRLLAWARERRAASATLVVASVSLLVTLAFLGSDVGQRRADSATASALITPTTWQDEALRYTRLTYGDGYGTPLRRGSFVLMALTLVAFLTRRRDQRSDALLDLPSASIGVGLLLLFATPDKWPWHFGPLLGIAAVAVAAETARLRSYAATSRGWQARPLLALVAVMVATVWLWSPLRAWNVLDLRTLDWTCAFFRLSLSDLVALPLLLMLVVAVSDLVRRDVARPWRVPWRVASWTALIFAVPLVTFTTGVLIVDAAKTPGWTLLRQNLDELQGTSNCGLADGMLVASPRSAHGASNRMAATPGWVPPPPVDGLPRHRVGTRWRSVGALVRLVRGSPRWADRRIRCRHARPHGRPHRLLGSAQAPSCAAAGIRTGDRALRVAGRTGRGPVASRHGERAAAPATPGKRPSRESPGDFARIRGRDHAPSELCDDAVRPSARECGSPLPRVTRSPPVLPVRSATTAQKWSRRRTELHRDDDRPPSPALAD